MKKVLIIIALVAFAFLSCSKEDEAPVKKPAPGFGYIERKFVPLNAHSISNAEVVAVSLLFTSNGINKGNFRYLQYLNDSLQISYPPYTKVNYKSVRLDQYTNGLRIFNGDMAFVFKNDLFHYLSGATTKGTYLDTVPHTALYRLRTLFLDDMEETDHLGSQYKDSSLSAEFGYYNLNAGKVNGTENLVKAWKVTPKNRVAPSDYPQAFYNDNDGKLIYYDNGKRFFR